MIDPRGRHQDGKQTQYQGVVRARSHARRWPDHRLASVAWNPARPRHWRPCGGPPGASNCLAPRCRTRRTQIGGCPGAPCTGKGRQRYLSDRRPRYASPGAASCPTRARQRVTGEGLSCGNDTST
ncbi:hypothetical protein XarbCFBP7610_12880 [Xanthomonas arboricola]|nr:hypothetical protein XarbCFBP7610_12880 [Xanthomonas arboricola]